ncbi:hypothetical protein FWK35_00004252 [Aphis craccivora]|uniref:Uncharacterized protein n=2 Tax=Aphis craccivora TaxID=307492 RepID=A0A6G0ZNA5_APHCR|nr:hypothetical protein FWK35_00004252 [Aphis craccivora]
MVVTQKLITVNT